MNFHRVRLWKTLLFALASISGPLLSAPAHHHFVLPTGSALYQAGNFTLAQNGSVNVGSLSLVMQSDGNLVLYQQDGTPVWYSGSGGQDCSAGQCFADFQADGNFVVYNGSTPLWSSGTSGYPGAQLVISEQSPQVEILDSNQSVIWANVLTFSAGTFTLNQGASIAFGSLSLVMQVDGNLVLYNQYGAAIWFSGTGGQDCSAGQCFADFQTDGNFVVYNGSVPLWSSGTSGYSDGQLLLTTEAPELEIVDSSYDLLWANDPLYTAGTLQLTQDTEISIGSSNLVMQSDGNLVLYGPDGTPTWDAGTSGQDCSAGQCAAIYQTDGNFVVYNGATPLWSSGTSDPNGELLLSGQSPQLQILGGDFSILWASAYTFDAGNFTLNQGTSVNFYSLSLVMQSDGNLVLYDVDGTPLWYTSTGGQDCGTNQCYVTLQSDGNLVVYNGSTALWTSGTSGDPGAQLMLYPDAPQIEVIGSDQSVLYANARKLRANQRWGSARDHLENLSRLKRQPTVSDSSTRLLHGKVRSRALRSGPSPRKLRGAAE